MARLNVEIVTPERRFTKVEADEVVAPGAKGLFGVRPGHAGFLSSMECGPVTVTEGTQKTVYFVSGGFVEVGPATVRVLADSAELKASIDVAAAQNRIAQAQAKLGDYEVTDPRAVELQAKIRVEKKRIEVARGQTP